MNLNEFTVNTFRSHDKKKNWDFITCFPQQPRRRRSTCRFPLTEQGLWKTTLNNTQYFRMNGDISISLCFHSCRHINTWLYAGEGYQIVQQFHGNLATSFKTIKAYREVIDASTMYVYEKQCFQVNCKYDHFCDWIVDSKLQGKKIKIVITFVVDWIGDLEFHFLKKESPIYGVIQAPLLEHFATF